MVGVQHGLLVITDLPPRKVHFSGQLGETGPLFSCDTAESSAMHEESFRRCVQILGRPLLERRLVNFCLLHKRHCGIDSPINLRTISEHVSFAAFWDPLLIYALKRTSLNLNSDQQFFLVALMVACIPVSKMVKIFLIAEGSLATCIST